jgi:hypothetical protein
MTDLMRIISCPAEATTECVARQECFAHSVGEGRFCAGQIAVNESTEWPPLPGPGRSQ